MSLASHRASGGGVVEKVTCIRAADWVVAWDETNRRHVYRRHIDVVFAGSRLVFVGPQFTGRVDETIDGRALLVIPGLIDIHAHPTTEPAFKGVRETHGVPEMYMSGLYERVVGFRLDEAGRQAAAEVAYSELLASGVTSLLDLSAPLPGWLDLIARSGLRGFVAPGYASARWHLENNHELKFQWDEAAGRRGHRSAQRPRGGAAQDQRRNGRDAEEMRHEEHARAESGRRQREDEREVGSAHPEQRLERLQENTERVERAERKVEHGGGHDGAPGARPDRGVVHDAPGNYGNRAATRMRARGAASGVTTALRRSPRTES